MITLCGRKLNHAGIGFGVSPNDVIAGGTPAAGGFKLCARTIPCSKIVIAAIVNGMALLGLPAAIQLMATALVLIVSVMVDVFVRRRGETTR